MPSLFDKIQDSFVVGSLTKMVLFVIRNTDRSDEGVDEGRVALITGAIGIGFATALELATWDVCHLLCKNPERGTGCGKSSSWRRGF